MTMNFAINSASENKKYLISPQKNTVQSAVPKISKEVKDKKACNQNTFFIGLGALGVIASAGIVIRNRNLKRVSSDFTEKTANLKGFIRKAYLAKKAEILKNHNAVSVNQDGINQYSDLKNKASIAIKERLKNLQKDDEWMNLRKLRKNLLKTIEREKFGETCDIASKKIEMINNVLICKLYPEEEQAFKNNTLMDVSDAVDIINKTFTKFEDFDNEYLSRQKYEFDFNLDDKFFFTNSKLTLKDLFPEEVNQYQTSKEKIQELKFEPKKILHEKLKALAQEFRAREDVKNFKISNAENQQTDPAVA